MCFFDELDSEQKPNQVKHFGAFSLIKGINSHNWLGF
jgi:hypothetical protein